MLGGALYLLEELMMINVDLLSCLSCGLLKSRGGLGVRCGSGGGAREKYKSPPLSSIRANPDCKNKCDLDPDLRE